MPVKCHVSNLVFLNMLNFISIIANREKDEVIQCHLVLVHWIHLLITETTWHCFQVQLAAVAFRYHQLNDETDTCNFVEYFKCLGCLFFWLFNKLFFKMGNAQRSLKESVIWSLTQSFAEPASWTQNPRVSLESKQIDSKLNPLLKRAPLNICFIFYISKRTVQKKLAVAKVCPVLKRLPLSL